MPIHSSVSCPSVSHVQVPIHSVYRVSNCLCLSKCIACPSAYSFGVSCFQLSLPVQVPHIIMLIQVSHAPKCIAHSIVSHMHRHDTHYDTSTMRCSLWGAHYEVPTMRCPLWDAHDEMPMMRCPWWDAHDEMPTMRCPWWDAHHMPMMRCPWWGAHYEAPTICPRWGAHTFKRLFIQCIMSKCLSIQCITSKHLT